MCEQSWIENVQFLFGFVLHLYIMLFKFFKVLGKLQKE